METTEKIAWRNLGNCFPVPPDDGFDPPWTFDYDGSAPDL